MPVDYKEINAIVRACFNHEIDYGTISERVIRCLSHETIVNIINTNAQWRECVFSQISIYSNLYESQANTKYGLRKEDSHE